MLLQNLPEDNTNVVVYSTKVCELHYNSNNPSSPLAATKDHLYMLPLIFLFRKTSPLAVEFNRQLQLLQETGLIGFWFRNITSSSKSNETRDPKKLEMTSILAAFQICAAMYIVSVLVFILELVSVKSKRIKRIIDYLTY